MNRFVTVVLMLVLLCQFGCGEKKEAAVNEPGPDLASLIAAERDFAAQVYDKGVRGAFLDNLAANAVIFNPLPVNGATYYEEHEDKPTLLEWEPTFADISRAGRMGYTTGPWEFRSDSTDAQPSVFGHYVSVWRRPPAGDWKVVLDVGVPHARPDTPSVELTWPKQPLDEKVQVVVDFEAAQHALMEVDRALSEASVVDGFVETLLLHASENIRVYRAGAFPAVGKEPARTLLAGFSGSLSWEPEAASVSRSGDLGYTYGTAELRTSADEPVIQKKLSYLRIWKKGEHNRWQVVVDLALEQPEGSGEED